MGAGAVGSYYGALLARDGHDVTLVARGPHLDALRESGRIAVREPDGARWEAPVRASATPEDSPDLVIVTTKSHHTLAAARAIAPVVSERTSVLSLQNGVENVARIATVVPADRVLGGHRLRGAGRGRARQRAPPGRGARRHRRSGGADRARPARPRPARALVGRDPVAADRARPVVQAPVERGLQRHLRRDGRDGRRGPDHARLARRWCARRCGRWWPSRRATG